MHSDRRNRTPHRQRRQKASPEKSSSSPVSPPPGRSLKGRTVVRLAAARPSVPLQARDRQRYALRPGERARYGLVIDPASGRVKMGKVSRARRPR